MAATVNDRDILIMGGTRTEPVTLPSDISVSGNVTGTVNGVAASTLTAQAQAGYDIQQKLEVSGTAVLKGVLVPTDSGALKTGSITWNSTTGALTGGTGIAVTEWGIIGAAAGVTTFTLEAATGAATFKGNISGGANIDISGNAKFNGSFIEGGVSQCVVANTSKSTSFGVRAYAGNAAGLYGVADSVSGTAGVWGQGDIASGYGVLGSASVSTAKGVKAQHEGSGTALSVVGPMTMTSTSTVSNLNADMVDGNHINTICTLVVCDTGTCNVNGAGFNLNVTISGVQSRGTSNIVVIENTSDIRLKEDIAEELLGLEFIQQLKPVTYRWKNKPAIKYHGFIAQHVRPLIEDEDDSLFTTNDIGMHGVDYMSLLSPLVKGIQELSQKIETLENRK